MQKTIKKDKTFYNTVIKRRFHNGMRIKELDLLAFHELSEKDKVFAVHYNSDCCLSCYKKHTSILFRNMSDGFTKMGAFDAIRPSNRTGISDPTATAGIKRAAFSEGQLENVYSYGDNIKMDMLIELERAIKTYENMIALYDETVQTVLVARMHGLDYEEISDEIHIAAKTLRQYVCSSKDYLDEYYDTVKELEELKEKYYRN